MRHRGFLIGTAALLAAFSVTGCDMLDQIVGADDWEEWTPDQTSLQLSLDGGVTETIFDTLDQSYYNADELQDMIAKSVRLYNEEHGEDSIGVPGFSAENGKIQLTMTYKSPEDYTAYNDLNLFNGSILEAQMGGITFPDTFLKVDGGSGAESVSSEEALSHKELSAAVADSGHVVQVPGRILYISGNAEYVNSHVAAPKADAGPETEQKETGLVLPSNAVYYETEPEEEGIDADLSTQKESDFFIIYEADRKSVV